MLVSVLPVIPPPRPAWPPESWERVWGVLGVQEVLVSREWGSTGLLFQTHMGLPVCPQEACPHAPGPCMHVVLAGRADPSRHSHPLRFRVGSGVRACHVPAVSTPG